MAATLHSSPEDKPRLAQVGNLFPLLQSTGDCDDLFLGHAIDHQVGLAGHEDTGLYHLTPVVIVGNTTQGCFDSSGDHGYAGKGLATALAIHRHRTVRTTSRLSPWRVGII